MPSDRYQYNEKYDVYEDMQEDDNFMRNLYDKSLKYSNSFDELKIYEM